MRAAALILLSLSLGVAAPAAAASLLPLNVQVASSSLSIYEGGPAGPFTLIAGPSTSGSITWVDSGGGSGSMSVSGGTALQIDFGGTLGSGVYAINYTNSTVTLDLAVPDLGDPTTTLLFLPTFSETAAGGSFYADGGADHYSSAIAGASIGVSIPTTDSYDVASGTKSTSPGTLATFIAGDQITLPLSVSMNFSSGQFAPSDFSTSFGLAVYAVVPEPGSLPLLLAAGLACAAYLSATPKRSA